jgi:C4-dicarboxylate transporter DctM subunit
LGALLALVPIAAVYNVWRSKKLAPILTSTIKGSTMLLLIICMSLYYSYVMSFLHISQSAAQWVADMFLLCVFPGIATGLPDMMMRAK